MGAEETNGSDFAGCKKSPVTVTREGGVSAPDWRREVEHARKWAEREREKAEAEGEASLVLKEKEKREEG